MARSIIAKRLQLNDKEVFETLSHKVVNGLVSNLKHLPVLSIEIVFAVSLDYFECDFQSKERFQNNIKQLGEVVQETIQFATSYCDELLLEIYAPYSETKWDEFYVDLSHGIKRRIVAIKHIMNACFVPEFTLSTPIDRELTQLNLRTMQQFQQFPQGMATGLAYVEHFLDEDYLETLFGDRT